MMNMNTQRRYAGISTKAMETNTSTKKKITDYCIIDHMGALESEEVMKEAYRLAYSLTEFPKMTYTMKKLIQAGVPYAVDTVSNKQKNMIRFNKHPKQVIVIISAEIYYSDGYYDEDKHIIINEASDFRHINSKTKWILDNWAEKVDNLTIILCEEGHNPEIITMQDLHPEWYITHEATDSVYRRCANIWANALGWSFSAPLYRDTVGGMNENFHIRPDFKENKDSAVIAGHFSKISSKPSTFIKTTAVASEDECKQFFEYYRYLQQSGLLTESLEPGYQLCPHCGRPIAIDTAQLNLKEVPDAMFESTKSFKVRDEDKTCNHCDLVIPAELFFETDRYFDDTYEEDEM